MAKSHVLVSIATRRETVEWEFGRLVLEAFCRASEKLTPEFVGMSEPIKTPFGSIEACQTLWAPTVVMRGQQGRSDVKYGMLWKRSRAVKSDGLVSHTSVNKLGKIKFGQIIFRAQTDRTIDWCALFRRLCDLSQPKFAMLHIFTEAELGKATFGSPESHFQIGPPGWTLDNGIPNLAWANFLGDELATEVDADQLKSHGFAVESIGKGYLLTVTENFFDVPDDFARFSARRAELKGLFRSGLFQITNEPSLEAAPTD